MKLSDWLEQGETWRKANNIDTLRGDWFETDSNGDVCAVCALSAAALASGIGLCRQEDYTDYDWYAVTYGHDGEASLGDEYQLPMSLLREYETRRVNTVSGVTTWLLGRFDKDQWSVDTLVEVLRKVGL